MPQKFWLGGRVVMQRTATPCTPVQFRPQPPFSLDFSSVQIQLCLVGRLDESIPLNIQTDPASFSRSKTRQIETFWCIARWKRLICRCDESRIAPRASSLDELTPGSELRARVFRIHSMPGW